MQQVANRDIVRQDVRVIHRCHSFDLLGTEAQQSNFGLPVVLFGEEDTTCSARERIWVKSGPGNNAKIEISQIWVKYGSENGKHKTNHNLPTVLMLWQYVGIVFETTLSKHGRQILADPESIISIFHFFQKMD